MNKNNKKNNKVKVLLLEKSIKSSLTKFLEFLKNDKNIEIQLLAFTLLEIINYSEFNKYDIDSLIFEYNSYLEDSFTSDKIIQKIKKIEKSIFALFSSYEKNKFELEGFELKEGEKVEN